MRKYPKVKYIEQFTMVPNTGPFILPREKRKKGLEFRLRREVLLTN
jgi:hypothetical protein